MVCPTKWTYWVLAGLVSLALTAKVQAVEIGGECPPHTVHGHISTIPPTHSGTVSHEHHGAHGHTGAANCPPHAPGHSAGLTAEPEGFLFNGISVAAPVTFVAGVNQDGALNGDPSLVSAQSRKVRPARRGAAVQLFGSAAGFFLLDPDGQDYQRVIGFKPPASGTPLYFTTSLPEVRIGDSVAPVLFSGLTPGLVGVWQINLLIPVDAPPGRLPVKISYEGDELRSVDVWVE